MTLLSAHQRLSSEDLSLPSAVMLAEVEMSPEPIDKLSGLLGNTFQASSSLARRLEGKGLVKVLDKPFRVEITSKGKEVIGRILA